VGLAGTVLLARVGRLGWGPLRQLPPSMRPHFRGLPGHLRDGELVSSGLLLVVTGRAPRCVRWLALRWRWGGRLVEVGGRGA